MPKVSRAIRSERAFVVACMELDQLAERMAEASVASTYDALLEAAARLQPRLPRNYSPSELPTDNPMIPLYAHLTVNGKPFPFSDHPDAVSARLLGAYHALTNTPTTRE